MNDNQIRVNAMPKSHTSSRRHTSRGACDFCRQKRIKCIPAGGERTLMWVQPGHNEVCQVCQVAGSACTFRMAVKKRGPARGSKKGIPRTQEDQVRSPTGVSLPGSTVSAFESSPSWTDACPPTLPLSVIDTNVQVFNTTSCTSLNSSAIDSIFHSPTDRICSRSTYLGLIQTYLDFVYPTIPIVHRPTFIRDIENNKPTHDSVFLSLTISICATIVALIPRKFEEYQNASEPLRFQTRTQMIDACSEFVKDLRSPDYVGSLNVTKWAIAYMFQIAYVQVGVENQVTSFWKSECAQIAQLLKLEDPKSYLGLDFIESQLRKKAFWLIVFIFVHRHISSVPLPHSPVYEKEVFDSIPVEDLWPIEVDDEYISAEAVLPQPTNILSLTTGFNAGAHLFWTAGTHLIPGSRRRVLSPSSISNIDCHFAIWSLNSRIKELQAANEGLHPRLGPWNAAIQNSLNQTEEHILNAQFESLQANIQVTRLWLQSTLLENLFALQQRDGILSEHSVRDSQYNQREEIGQQLLSVLQSIRQCSLEPNGNILTRKIREVAATLLNSPLEQQGTLARRAKSYAYSFVDILARLDITEYNRQFFLDTQAWSDVNNFSKSNHPGGSLDS